MLEKSALMKPLMRPLHSKKGQAPNPSGWQYGAIGITAVFYGDSNAALRCADW